MHLIVFIIIAQMHSFQASGVYWPDAVPR